MGETSEPIHPKPYPFYLTYTILKQMSESPLKPTKIREKTEKEITEEYRDHLRQKQTTLNSHVFNRKLEEFFKTKSAAAITAGAVSGAIADKLWYNWPGHTAYAAGESPLSFIEHHHWALAGLLSDKYLGTKGLGTGAATMLLISEALGDNPFGIGKPPDPVRGNVTLTAILTGLLLL